MTISRGLELDNEAVLHKEVCEVFANEGAVFVIDVEWVLLQDFEAVLAQAVGKGVFIDLFQVAMAAIEMDVVGGLPDGITELVHRLHVSFWPQKNTQHTKKEADMSDACNGVTGQSWRAGARNNFRPPQPKSRRR